MINIKDANDHWVVMREEDIWEAFTENKITVFGFGIKEILAFKEVYEIAGGPYPATEKSIKEIFIAGSRVQTSL